MEQSTELTTTPLTGTVIDKDTPIWPVYSDKTEIKSRFLDAFTTCGQVYKAAYACGIVPARHYRWLQQDEVYRRSFAEAEQIVADLLESEVVRRAVEGTEEPIYRAGELVGTTRKYSDLLLIFATKGAKPDKYADRQRIDHRVTAVKVYEGFDPDDV
jgi:hypothetical protein